MKSYFEIKGDGGSRILDQVEEQRAKIARNMSGVRHMVALGSGKGGVGKSTLTLQLAAAVRAKGFATAILDADLNGPSQARMSGVREAVFAPGAMGLALPRTRDGIGVFSMGSLVPERQALDFESVSQGESYTWRATREFALLGELLGILDWGRLDFLFVDLPPGAERTFQYAEYLGSATAFVLVTIPSDLARGVVARSIAALAKTPNRLLGTIENMSGYYCAACKSIRPLFPSTKALDLGIPCLGSVPFDPELAAMGDDGVPITERPHSASAKSLYAIADRLVRALEMEA